MNKVRLRTTFDECSHKVKFPLTKTSIYRGNLSMCMAPYRYTLKKIAKRWQSRNVITSIGLGFTIFCSVSSDNFFIVTYTFFYL